MDDKKERPVREPSPIERLKAQPKAFQIGPQLHLRKGFPHGKPQKLKGGTENE